MISRFCQWFDDLVVSSITSMDEDVVTQLDLSVVLGDSVEAGQNHQW
ncbi:hypothetical protein [Vibrio vulnificus]|nr:hypothetical protein [Vibrio vulnificus]MCG6288884.1 hypothetical protein [Vibrio vulnificus]